MLSRQLLLALLIALGGQSSIAGAQDKPKAEAPAAVQADPQVKTLARSLLDSMLRVSHAADIFSDLRRTLKDVYIPAVRDAIEGNLPGVPPPGAKSAAAMAKLLTVMDYMRKAGDELDVALTENREAMLSDAAEQIAKTAKPFEIKDVKAIVDLPAVRKGLDAFYAVTKLATGFSYNDTRTFSDFSAWANGLELDLQGGLPGAGGNAVPSKRKIAKAQALTDDLFSLSHLDEMASDIRRFVREVYAETAPMSDEDRNDLREQADQYEFMYNMQKAVALAAAPSVVAASLSEDQIEKLHGFVRSPAFGKAFDLFRNAVKAGTSFTKEDVLQAQKSFEDIQKRAQANERSQADQEKAKADWDALIAKWTERLKNRISPEVREGLQKSLEDIQTSGPPI
jgi:hypothetical protein